MEIIIAIISILVITTLAWIVRRYLLVKICPICAGVALTWVWMFLGMLFGWLPIADYQLSTAILMGGTIVGSMFKLEKFIKPGGLLVWKTIYVLSGFLAMSGLIVNNWLLSAVGAILVVAVTFAFKIPKEGTDGQASKQAKELEEKMKNCC